MKDSANGYILTVTQLNNYAVSLFDNDALLSAISVRGEVSGFKRHSSGHIYFSLKDADALIRCVMFRQNAWGLDIDVRDGMQVTVQGRVSLYVKDGQYQLYASRITKEGEGELYRRFAMLKTRLEAQGLFDEAHKKPLPRLPKCIGIVTSQTGAALRDMLNVIRRRYPHMDIAVCPSDVQGEGAAGRIAGAIRRLDALQLADVIIVGRGGGSIEDLWAFNEETVARAIYECTAPVISAVGHETDFTIADFVADLRAPTPSAAAELCVPEYEAMLNTVEARLLTLNRLLAYRLEAERQRVSALCSGLTPTAYGHMVSAKRSALKAAQDAAKARVAARMALAGARVGRMTASIDALSPSSVLGRGYALLKHDGRYISDTASLRAAGEAEIYMRDGSIHIVVPDTEENA